MAELYSAFTNALKLLLSNDRELLEIVALSLRVSLSAVLLAACVGLPLGAILALWPFPGRKLLVILMNTLMGLPPVVLGLIIYLLLSRSGPLGELGLLFTPSAMIIAQWLLVTPIITSMTRQLVEDLWREYEEQLRSFGASPGDIIWTLLWEGRFSLMTVILAGFGRALAEVGAVLMVGGNIAHATRVMTTAIVLESAKGELTLALGLGLILITLALIVNATIYLTKDWVQRLAG